MVRELDLVESVDGDEAGFAVIHPVGFLADACGPTDGDVSAGQ
jgi:hypothetical protein